MANIWIITLARDVENMYISISRGHCKEFSERIKRSILSNHLIIKSESHDRLILSVEDLNLGIIFRIPSNISPADPLNSLHRRRKLHSKLRCIKRDVRWSVNLMNINFLSGSTESYPVNWVWCDRVYFICQVYFGCVFQTFNSRAVLYLINIQDRILANTQKFTKDFKSRQKEVLTLKRRLLTICWQGGH